MFARKLGTDENRTNFLKKTFKISIHFRIKVYLFSFYTKTKHSKHSKVLYNHYIIPTTTKPVKFDGKRIVCNRTILVDWNGLAVASLRASVHSRCDAALRKTQAEEFNLVELAIGRVEREHEILLRRQHTHQIAVVLLLCWAEDKDVVDHVQYADAQYQERSNGLSEYLARRADTHVEPVVPIQALTRDDCDE